ncbi:3-oxoacyl-ACP reductase [Rhizobium laguerreae]|nr:3-oxoacyl-ACP reductase [Rhizobium laguerreae]TBX99875.1 3-oxoacyl-ACP reductase [Rhizobium laguerreae]
MRRSVAAFRGCILKEADLDILSVALRTPSRLVSNNDILDFIREHNGDKSAVEVEAYCGKIDRLLKNAGALTRFIRDRRIGERAIDLLIDATKSALTTASLATRDIDLIIYCGVGRGFLEPANAAFVGAALGIEPDAFDITEACMSWARALQIAQNFQIADAYRNILIVNAEFCIFENGFPEVFQLRGNEELAYSFPALTVGEAATATVVTASPNHWSFRFRTKPQFAALCSMPLPGYSDFCIPDERTGTNGPHQLTAHGAELTRAARREMTAFVQETYQTDLSIIDLWLPHSSSESALKRMSKELGIGDRLYDGVFRKFGNLASASIPAAIDETTKNGRLTRGQRVVFCPASAGMVFGLIEGIY